MANGEITYENLQEAKELFSNRLRKYISLKEWIGREPTEEEKQIVAEINRT